MPFTIEHTMVFMITTTIICYLTAAGLQGLYLLGWLKNPAIKNWIRVIGILAVSFHGYLLYCWIDTVIGQNLAPVNILSMITWLSALLVLLISLYKPVLNLVVFCLPLAALSMLLVRLFPDQYLINTADHPEAVIHVLLAILAFSILVLAALQALLLAMQDWQLRRKQPWRIIYVLPPLETMEILLFQLIGLGFIILSMVLVSSFLLLRGLEPAAPLNHKVELAIVAWVLFAALLIGRYCYGWRGRTAIQWTLAGVGVLMLSYFGSQFLLK